MLTRLIVVIISQYIQIWNYYIVHLKLMLFAKYTSIRKREGKKERKKGGRDGGRKEERGVREVEKI